MDGSSRPHMEFGSEDSGDSRKMPESALSPAQTADMLKYKFDRITTVIVYRTSATEL